MTNQIPLTKSPPIESWGESIAAGVFLAVFIAILAVLT
jgi:hypothetical protein